MLAQASLADVRTLRRATMTLMQCSITTMGHAPTPNLPVLTVMATPRDGITYEFSIEDEYSDGMCCNYGEGSYTIFRR